MLGHGPDAEATDRALSALSHACRRRLLFELYEEVEPGETVPISAIHAAPFWTERRRILLYHVHLPKLAEHGYITWNRAEETIRRGPRWDEIEPLLDLVHSHLSELPPFLQGKPSGGTGSSH